MQSNNSNQKPVVKKQRKTVKKSLDEEDFSPYYAGSDSADSEILRTFLEDKLEPEYKFFDY